MRKSVQFATKDPRRTQRVQLPRHAPLRAEILTALLLVLCVDGTPAAAQGSPGEPQPPVVVFIEEFENVSTPTVAVFLDDYTGPPPLSMTYTADPAWISGPACNGLIASWNSGPGTTGCSASVYNTFIRPIAQALGNEFGGGDDNQAMADVTRVGFPAPPTPAATLQTVSPVPLPSSNRFIAFSIDVGVTTCAAAGDPLLRFFLVDGMTEISVNNAAINPCTAPGGTTVPGGSGGIRIGTFSTDGSILFAGNSIGVKLTNDQTSGSGNDYAVDNIRLLDATPQLDKAFATNLALVGTPVALTFTITNTSELAAKQAWSFQDALPAGLTVADPANATTDCTNGVITASPGGSLIAVSGDLETGQAFCTASVDVTSVDPASYENGPDDVFDLVGLDPPGTTEVTFVVLGLLLEKAGSAPNPVDAGDTVDYTFIVQNTSTVTVTNVTVGDPLPGLSPIACPATTLAPGEIMTCTATYTVTQANLDTGAIDNTATAAAEPPGALPPLNAQDSATVVLQQAPAISLDKTGTGPDPLNVGDLVTYSFAVTNTGNVTLTNVTVTDPLPGMSPISCPGTVLAPGESLTCTATYTVTQADADAGFVANTATATGAPPTGPSVSDQDTAVVPPSQKPSISLEKSASGPEPLDVGDTVTYSFVVTNTGNVTLTDVTVTDPLPGLSPISCVASTLAPGESTTCTATHTVTQADVDAGVITNTATATGQPPGALPSPTGEGSVTVPLEQSPSIALDKSGSGPDPLTVGDTVTYSFVVTNTGNVTLTEVTVTDPLPGLSAIDCPGTTLAPGESMTCTATYTVTLADAEAGEVQNTATVIGESPAGAPASDQGSATVPPELSVLEIPVLSRAGFLLLVLLLSVVAVWTLRRAGG